MDKEYKQQADSGSLHASKSKRSAKSPDYWGKIAIDLKNLTNIQTEDGLTIIKLSGWKKTSKSGQTYLSLAVDRFVPENKSDQSNRYEDRSQDEDVPF